MNINQERERLIKSLRNKAYRDAFVSAYTDETIPFQVRTMREQEGRKWTQEELATRAGMKQERISTIENPNYGSHSLRTLKQLAAAFDVALMVRFVPFSELAEWKLRLSSKSLEVPSFGQESYFKKKPENGKDLRELLEANYSIKASKERPKQSAIIYKLTEHPEKTPETEIKPSEIKTSALEKAFLEEKHETFIGSHG